jgi:hypothetical protein
MHGFFSEKGEHHESDRSYSRRPHGRAISIFAGKEGLAMKVYTELARLLIARVNCEKSGNTEWHEKHSARIDEILENKLPHGSGFDRKTTIYYTKSNDQKMVFYSSFHCMNENGYYDGWIEYKIIARASLSCALTVDVIGREYHGGLKDYVADCFRDALTAELIDATTGSD